MSKLKSLDLSRDGCVTLLTLDTIMRAPQTFSPEIWTAILNSNLAAVSLMFPLQQHAGVIRWIVEVQNRFDSQLQDALNRFPVNLFDLVWKQDMYRLSIYFSSDLLPLATVWVQREHAKMCQRTSSKNRTIRNNLGGKTMSDAMIAALAVTTSPEPMDTSPDTRSFSTPPGLLDPETEFLHLHYGVVY